MQGISARHALNVEDDNGAFTEDTDRSCASSRRSSLLEWVPKDRADKQAETFAFSKKTPKKVVQQTETVRRRENIVMEDIWWQFAFIHCWELWKDKLKDESKRIWGIQNKAQARLKVITKDLTEVTLYSLHSHKPAYHVGG